jgi:flagellum-specific peptidoglycan hydrolase FlgJ
MRKDFFYELRENILILKSKLKIFLIKANVKATEFGLRWYHLVAVLFSLILLLKIDFTYSLNIVDDANNLKSDERVFGFAYLHDLKKPDIKTSEVKKVDQKTKINKDEKPKKSADKERLGENSEFAPSNPDKLDKFTTEEYIKKYKSIAISEMKRTRVPASITMAQAIIESASGNSRLARQINNHFGIKCHSRNCKKGHCMNYSDDSHKDFFRKFNTPEESYRAHSAVVLKERYTSLLRGRKDYKAWAYALQNGGYATGKKYAAKLIRVIEMYNLHKLDN